MRAKLENRTEFGVCLREPSMDGFYTCFSLTLSKAAPVRDAYGGNYKSMAGKCGEELEAVEHCRNAGKDTIETGSGMRNERFVGSRASCESVARSSQLVLTPRLPQLLPFPRRTLLVFSDTSKTKSATSTDRDNTPRKARFRKSRSCVTLPGTIANGKA